MTAAHREWIGVEDALPPVDQEVIVLSNEHNLGFAHISFGHIVDKRFAKDYNGWNIPNVTHWIYCPTIPRMYSDIDLTQE